MNELRISNRWCLSQPITGNVLPPNDFRGFTGETSGRVFRYSNGFIEEAPDYWWERPQEMDSPGNIVTYDRDETGGCTVDENGECNIFVTADFATCVAFDCWRFAPRLFSWVDPFDQDEAIEWFFPRFLESPVNPGVSIVNGQGYRYTIGRNSGWGVIPQTFNHPSANAPQSRGLSGDLSLILGLMALTRDVGRTDDIASRWNGPGHPWTGHSIVGEDGLSLWSMTILGPVGATYVCFAPLAHKCLCVYQ